jgi:hypothetical protein
MNNILTGRFIRSIVPILIASILMMSCSASQHAGKTHMKRPPMTETDGEKWYAYWQDQFDAKEGKVIAPGSKFPEIARNAYTLALADREKKEQTASFNTIFTILGGVLGISILIAVITASSVPDTPSDI